jgi:hypothetical protein
MYIKFSTNMNKTKVLTNPDLFTNILSYLDKENLKLIVPTFKKHLHYEYIVPTNHILLYGQVQAGKTNKIINYIKKYNTDTIKIVIMQNSVNMQEQYKKILINNEIKYKIIDTNALSYSYNKEQVLITIYNKYRMNILLKYMIQNNIKNYCLVLDESDQYLDKIKTNKVFESAKNVLHVTATPFKYAKKFNVDNIITLNPSQNYVGINQIDIETINLVDNNAEETMHGVNNKIIDILQQDFLKCSEGFMLINCFSRINKMKNIAHNLSNMYIDIPFIVLSSTTYIVINGITSELKTKNIQKLIDSFNMHTHVVFIANRLSNRGINYTNTNYTRHISHQISIANGNYTGFLQKCRIFGIREEANNQKPKIYCLITEPKYLHFVNKLKRKIEDLPINMETKLNSEQNNKNTVKQLKKMCKENNIKGFSKLRKQNLIELLKLNNIIV